MAKAAQPTEGQFSRLYAQMTGGAGSVAEPAQSAQAEPAEVREKIVRCLWFDQFLDSANLATEDGRRIAVFSPGYWNEGAGPDFRNAEFAFGDEPRVRGDVEIHVAASDWGRHGHADDPMYDRVLLHVVLHNDLGEPTVAQRGRRIPQLALAGRLSSDLGEILGSLDPDAYPRVGCGREGACCRSVRACGRDAQWVGRFLDIAGDERMLRKAERFAGLIEKSTPDDALYEALMEVMGYSANRRAFRLLARAVPLRTLRKLIPADGDFRDTLLAVQALLFGAAGFLDAAEPTADPESARYLKSLRAKWDAARPDIAGRPFDVTQGGPEHGRRGHMLDRTAWSLRRTRPANHPIRRIAGIAAFLAGSLHTGLCRAMLRAIEDIPTGGGEARRCAETLRRFRAMFEEPQPFDSARGHEPVEWQTYWLRRTGFRPESLRQPTALIGPTRTTELIVNAVVPLLLALQRDGDRARVEQRLHNVYCSLRPLSDNSVTRYMKSRIFQEGPAAGEVVRSMRRQQGLMQIFHDYCESDSTTCEACGFLAAVEARGERA
ncbi:MAG: DUF2851 family protein [Candidatus Brocadiia bacterium]|jgi:hypothetical protein